jgi:hypothetical protein
MRTLLPNVGFNGDSVVISSYGVIASSVSGLCCQVFRLNQPRVSCRVKYKPRE